MVYFIACIKIKEGGEARLYREYIREVKPIVEQFGGTYLARSDKITHLSDDWNPDRVIMIAWDSKEQLEKCFSSGEYRRIAVKREHSVDSKAILVEG